MASTGRPDDPAVSGRVTATILAVVGLAFAWLVYSWVTTHIIGRSWDQDPAGPVYLSPDGRTLLAVGSPMNQEGQLGGCGSNITVDLESHQSAHTVALHYHLHQVGERNGPVGSCSYFPGYFLTLGRPLGDRTVTDSRGRSLALVDGRLAPQLHDPRLTERTSPTSCPYPGAAPGCPDVWLASIHTYTGRGDSWTYTQVIASVGQNGGLTGSPQALSTRVGDGPAVCLPASNGSAPALWWKQGDFLLGLSRRVPNPPSPDQAACALLVQEAGFVR
jgi:hypothetical protein